MSRLLPYADFKNYLNLQKTEAESPHITLLLDSLTARFEDYIQRKLAKAGYTETYIGTTRMVPLLALPVDGAQPITVTQEGEALDSTSYEVRGFGILLKCQECCFEKPVTVTYTGGFAASVLASGETVLAVPDSLKRAALIQLTHDLNTFRKPGTETIQTDAGTTTNAPMELLDEVKAMLSPYIHPIRPI